MNEQEYKQAIRKANGIIKQQNDIIYNMRIEIKKIIELHASGFMNASDLYNLEQEIKMKINTIYGKIGERKSYSGGRTECDIKPEPYPYLDFSSMRNLM